MVNQQLLLVAVAVVVMVVVMGKLWLLWLLLLSFLLFLLDVSYVSCLVFRWLLRFWSWLLPAASWDIVAWCERDVRICFTLGIMLIMYVCA